MAVASLILTVERVQSSDIMSELVRHCMCGGERRSPNFSDSRVEAAAVTHRSHPGNSSGSVIPSIGNEVMEGDIIPAESLRVQPVHEEVECIVRSRMRA